MQNPLRRFVGLLALALLPFFGGCASSAFSTDPHVGRGFSPWMTYREMSALLDPLEAKDETGKNFWAKGHWITAVEGRWSDGRPQFRVKVGQTPRGRTHAWYWWFNQDQASYNKHLHRLSDQGFTLVSHNTFTWPDGTVRYSGVWHKIGE